MPLINNMKRISLLFFLIVSSQLKSQTIDEIVTKHIEAIGGLDNWSKIKSMSIEKTMKANGASIVFKDNTVRNTGSRTDIILMGMNGWNIVTKNNGWSYIPWNGQTKAEAMTADEHKLAIEDLDILEDFLTYKQKGKSIEYYGMEDVDGTECFKIKMIDKNEKETTYFIDPDNYLTIKVTTKTKSNGQENENSTFYSNYKKLPEGIVYAMSNSSEWSESTITKIEINTTIDEKLFIPSK
jgi:hypothetical protein